MAKVSTINTVPPLYDGEFTLIVLSNAIDFFGVVSGDAEWVEARVFDYNRNRAIDIFDIAYVASRIG